MPTELTVETLAKDLKDIKVLVAGIKTADHEETPEEMKSRKAQEEKEMKEHEAKVAQEDKDEDEKMQAKRATRDEEINKAMEEDDHEKKEAMIKAAQDKYMNHEAFGKPDEKNHEATDEEKEMDAQVASIVNEKKNEIITKILSANSIMNPTAVKEVEARLKKASITEVEKEWNILAPAFEGSVARTPANPEKFIPFYANITPADVDASTLTAASPDSDFTKISTKELLEMGQ